MKKMSIRTHLAFSLIGYMMFGFSLGISFGEAGELSPEITLVIKIILILVFGVTVFTSLQKVREALRDDKEGKGDTEETKEG